MLPECANLKGRPFHICNGFADMPLAEINGYRRSWGYEDITEAQRITQLTELKESSGGLGDTIAIFIHSLTGVTPCGGCTGRQHLVNTIFPANSTTKFRKPKRRSAVKATKMKPFDGEIVRNLIYHIWPAKHTKVWQWNLDQLKQRLHVFNGRKIIGIAYDKSAELPETVQKYLEGFGCEFIIVKNNANLGELATFEKMMEAINTLDNNSVVFYAHAKGVKYGPNDQRGTIRRWTEKMYSGNLDDISKPMELLNNHIFVGGFRRSPASSGNFFYSGTFFWFRAAAIFAKKWKPSIRERWGVEYWPPTMCTYKESACLFGDNVGRLYDSENLDLALRGEAVGGPLHKPLQPSPEARHSPARTAAARARLRPRTARRAGGRMPLRPGILAAEALPERFRRMLDAVRLRVADQSQAAAAVQENRRAACSGCAFAVGGFCEINTANIERIIAQKSEQCPAGKWTHQKRKRTPFAESGTIRHLTYHIFPRRSPVENDRIWKWNLDQLIQRLHVFNGRKIINIVTDETTARPSEVKTYLAGFGCEFLEYQNDTSKQEGASFLPAIRSLKTSNPDELIFRAHAKGVRHDNFFTSPVKPWTESLYITGLDDIAAVENALESHAMAGSYKHYGGMRTRKVDGWHYAGAFYWFRSATIYARRQWENVHSARWGVEEWPCLVCTKDEAACLFYDFVKSWSLYHASEWGDVYKELNRWTTSRNLPAMAR